VDDLLEGSDQVHENDTEEKGGHLLCCLPQRRVLQQFRKHGYGSYVDESACSERENGGGGCGIGETRVNSQESEHTARKSTRSCDQLDVHRLSPRVP
ncbi:hypothetical protein PMAYCL1PPCAC_10983, partial [Pristionchus mayeri]